MSALYGRALAPVGQRNGRYSEAASIAGYRWFLNLSLMMPMDGFDMAMAHRVWVTLEPMLCCCHACDDNYWCNTGLDYYCSGIMIFLIKYYGHGNSRADRMLVRYIRGRFLDSPESRAEMIDFELEMIELCTPVVTRLQQEITTDNAL